MHNSIYVKIRRQDHPSTKSYWQEFEVPAEAKQNISQLLLKIQTQPITSKKKSTSPVIWQNHCQAGVCGSCGMMINGKARLACQTLVDSLPQPIVLEPLSQFKVIRDLWVDQSQKLSQIENKLKPWSYAEIHPQGLPSKGKFYLNNQKDFSDCVECGICLEVCPNHTSNNEFMGAFGIGKSKDQIHSSRTELQIKTLIDQGGIFDCSHAQNCGKYCPSDLSLDEIISQSKREVQKSVIKKFFD